MPRSHSPYPPQLRRQLVELVRAGRNPEDLAREFEPSAQAIRNWVAQADRDQGKRRDGLTTAYLRGRVTSASCAAACAGRRRRPEPVWGRASAAGPPC